MRVSLSLGVTWQAKYFTDRTEHIDRLRFLVLGLGARKIGFRSFAIPPGAWGDLMAAVMGLHHPRLINRLHFIRVNAELDAPFRSPASTCYLWVLRASLLPFCRLVR